MAFAAKHANLVKSYVDYRENLISDSEMQDYLSSQVSENLEELYNVIPKDFTWHLETYKKELSVNVIRKILRMKKIEIPKQRMPDSDIFDNIETAFMSALYMYYRELYNDNALALQMPSLATAIFVFIRNYSYSGMFRYNKDGEFNVPYGGIAYNHKSLRKKLNYYRSEKLLEHFSRTTVCNLDFEDFFEQHKPGAEDFVFLDPPYDSDFSTYAKNEFSRKDQERLANYLIHNCKAKWMMVIKNTDFIYSLYSKDNLNIKTFDKTYLVSFMNRNDKRAEHLIIMNY